MIHRTMIDALCVPTLMYPAPRECPNLVAAAFEFMKRIPARFCVERALHPAVPQVLDRDQGLFVTMDPDLDDMTTVLSSERNGARRLFIETSSGNMATGLAEVCREYGVPLYLLLPSEVDEGTRASLRELGATVEVVDTMDQTYRVEQLMQVQRAYAADGWDVWWVQQYSNPNNRASYWRLAELVASELDAIDILVAPVGTGGSSCGTSHFLRKSGFPSLELVGVDACGSVNFDHQPSEFLMGGLGSTRPMPLVDHGAYDVVHWMDDNTAFSAAIDLFNSGTSVGASSGAAFLAARYEAQRAPDKQVLVIFPDHGRRYATTFRSAGWRSANGVDLAAACSQPMQVRHPDESDPTRPGVEARWYRIEWRAYHDARARAALDR